MTNWRHNDDILVINQSPPRPSKFWVEISEFRIKRATAGGNFNSLGRSIIQPGFKAFMV